MGYSNLSINIFQNQNKQIEIYKVEKSKAQKITFLNCIDVFSNIKDFLFAFVIYDKVIPQFIICVWCKLTLNSKMLNLSLVFNMFHSILYSFIYSKLTECLLWNMTVWALRLHKWPLLPGTNTSSLIASILGRNARKAK